MVQVFIKYVNGYIYQGEFVNGLQEENGMWTYADGKIEKGAWKQGI